MSEDLEIRAMKRDGKSETLVLAIMKECENQGLTMQEVERLPRLLKFEIEKQILEQKKETNFKA